MPPRETPRRCPTCGQRVNPVYCAGSTDRAPLLLAYSVRQAARRLGVSPFTLRHRLRRWRGAWRLVPRTCDDDAA